MGCCGKWGCFEPGCSAILGCNVNAFASFIAVANAFSASVLVMSQPASATVCSFQPQHSDGTCALHTEDLWLNSLHPLMLLAAVAARFWRTADIKTFISGVAFKALS